MSIITDERELADLRSELSENVDRGAVLLDHNLPGWYDRIDLDTLKMVDVCGCVLGQLAAQDGAEEAISPYAIGFKQFAFPDEDVPVNGMMAERHGFITRAIYTEPGLSGQDVLDLAEQRYDILGELWRAAIQYRRDHAR